MLCMTTYSMYVKQPTCARINILANPTKIKTKMTIDSTTQYPDMKKTQSGDRQSSGDSIFFRICYPVFQIVASPRDAEGTGISHREI